MNKYLFRICFEKRFENQEDANEFAIEIMDDIFYIDMDSLNYEVEENG